MNSSMKKYETFGIQNEKLGLRNKRVMPRYNKKDIIGSAVILESDKVSILPTSYMRFFALKLYLQFVWLYFFDKSNLVQKLLVKCWRN